MTQLHRDVFNPFISPSFVFKSVKKSNIVNAIQIIQIPRSCQYFSPLSNEGMSLVVYWDFLQFRLMRRIIIRVSEIPDMSEFTEKYRYSSVVVQLSG